MDPITAKGLILMAACVVGGLSIFWGYRLFKTGIQSLPGTVEGGGAGFKIRLENFGPGVVFALFGACLVVFTVTRDFRTSTVMRGGFEGECTHYYQEDVAAAAGPSDDRSGDSANPK